MHYRALVKGFCYGIFTLFFGYVLLIAWVVLGTQQSYYLAPHLRLVFFISLSVAGFVGGVNARWQGWKHGGWVGIAVSLVALIVSGTVLPQLVSPMLVVRRLVVGAFLGGAAAVCGVNLAFVQRKEGLKRQDGRKRVL